MALSKADRWLAGVLLGVFLVGLGVLTAGVLLVRAVAAQFALPEAAEQPPGLEWEQVFVRGAFSRGNCVRETADGGFIVAAAVNTDGLDSPAAEIPERSMHLLKTGSGGDLEWEQVLRVNERSSPCSVWPTAGGGYLVIGTTEIKAAGRGTAPEEESGAGVDAIVLIKTDGAGNPEWEKVFEKDVSCRAEMGRPTDDGGCIVVGTIESAGEDRSPGIYLLKTDQAGETEWEQVLAVKEYRPELPRDPERAAGGAGQYVEQAADGGYIVAGLSTRELPGEVTLFKTDRSGVVEQEFALPMEGFLPATCAFTQAPEGGYVFAGDSPGNKNAFFSLFSPSISLTKLDEAGEREWVREYRRFSGVTSIQATRDGGYLILTGTFALLPFPHQQPALVKTDAGGGLRWVKTLTREREDPAVTFFAAGFGQTSDGGYIVTGGYDNGIFLARIGPDL